MAKQRGNPAQVARTINVEVRKILSAAKNGEYTKAEERAIAAAIKRLDKDLKDLRDMIHPWEFGRRPR